MPHIRRNNWAPTPIQDNPTPKQAAGLAESEKHKAEIIKLHRIRKGKRRSFSIGADVSQERWDQIFRKA